MHAPCSENNITLYSSIVMGSLLSLKETDCTGNHSTCNLCWQITVRQCKSVSSEISTANQFIFFVESYGALSCIKIRTKWMAQHGRWKKNQSMFELFFYHQGPIMGSPLHSIRFHFKTSHQLRQSVRQIYVSRKLAIYLTLCLVEGNCDFNPRAGSCVLAFSVTEASDKFVLLYKN